MHEFLQIANKRLGEGNLIFYCTGIWENYFRSIRRQHNNNSFRVSLPKNKNADHRVKETCSTRSIQVTYENDHIYLCFDPTMSKH